MNTTRCKWEPQSRRTHRNHFLTALLVAAMVTILTVPAFALDATANATAPDAESSVSMPDLADALSDEDSTLLDDEAGTSEATPAPTSGPVSTIEELLDAIANANENDVIEIDAIIHTPSELILGRADCPVTIRRATPEAFFELGIAGEGNIRVQNITFDGAGVQGMWPFVSTSSPKQFFERCNFVNNISEGGATLSIGYGETFISHCNFANNKGRMGAHLGIAAGCRKATIENCTFTGGYASDRGSVYIGAAEKSFLTGCTISGNVAGEGGGGLYIEGEGLCIEGCKIYGNTANGVPDDITKDYWSRLSLSDDYAALVELYHSDGVIPNKWTVDTRYNVYKGSNPERTDMIFSMTFVDNESVPTPEPEPETFIVTFNANGGTVFPASATTNESGTIVLPISEREGYAFDGWFMADGTPVTTDTIFTEDMEIHAQWTENEPDPGPEPLPTSITLSKSELTLDVGETDTLAATLHPEETNGNIQWTSSDPAVASVTESGLVTAHSAGTATITVTETAGGASALCRVTVQNVSNTPVIPTTTIYSVEISASPTEGGKVSGNGQYEKGSSVTVTAVPYEGFRFLAWSEAGAQISSESSLTFTMSSNRNLTAIFEPIPTPTCTINVTAAVGGTVSGAGEYELGASITLTATPESGYLFIGWMENGEQISTDENLTFIANCDRTIVADFALITQPTYAINVSTTAGGNTSGGGEYEQGSSVTLMATPEIGYLFVEWTENGEQISTEESFTFTADHDRTLVANFKPIPKSSYTIQVKSSQGGTAQGNGNYEEGELVTVTAVPDNGYRFLRWEENSMQISTEIKYSFTAEANRKLVAVFELIPQSTPNFTVNPPHDSRVIYTSYGPGNGKSQPETTFIPPQEETQIPTLTNGKAVLISPDDLFWKGYKIGRNNGTEPVTRADLAQLIYSMMDDESRKIYGAAQSLFNDVGPGVWYESAVSSMLNTGIMVGCGNGSFCPDRTLTWGELLTVFARFSEDQPLTEYYTGGHWAKDSVNKAFTLGWLKYTEAFDPGSIVTTGEMVDLIQAVFRWNNE